MIRKAKESDKTSILTYIGQDYVDCLYLYLNFRKYGCASTYVSTDISGRLSGVFLGYHNCLHIYSAFAEMDPMESVCFIKRKTPDVLFVNEMYNSSLQKFLVEDYEMHEMMMVEKSYRENCTIRGAYHAARKELPEIAEFLMSDCVYSTVYSSPMELVAQMEERENDGYGCTYVARENGKLIWTSSVVARDGFVCLESLIMLAPHLRKKGFGKAAVATLANILTGGGGLRIFAFPVEETLGINDALGYKHISNTIKWIRKGGSG